MIKRIFYNLMVDYHRKQGLKQLHNLEQKLQSQELRFEVPFSYRGKGLFKKIEPRQNHIEIENLYKEVCALTPSRVLEIGTARGGTLYLWTQAATDDATIVSVDLPGGEFGGAYPSCRVPFYQSFARAKQKLHLLRRDSHAESTREEVKKIFGDKSLDFVFIDGDHTYDGVKLDFELYAPLVRSGGIIGFHDILPRPDMPEIQVDRFWNDIKGKHDIVEFIGPDGSGRKIGIGLIRGINSII